MQACFNKKTKKKKSNIKGMNIFIKNIIKVSEGIITFWFLFFFQNEYIYQNYIYLSHYDSVKEINSLSFNNNLLLAHILKGKIKILKKYYESGQLAQSNL